MNDKSEWGAWGERAAAEYLVSCGYVILACNHHSRYGEIDIIAWDGGFVFVEVKSRSPHSVAEGRESVGYGKQKKLRRVALDYLAHQADNLPARFDVIEVVGGISTGVKSIEHIKDAF